MSKREGQTPQTVLAFDFGERRIGVATGNSISGHAQAQRSIHSQGNQRWLDIGQYVSQWQPDALLVGVPSHPDGTPHLMTERCQKFGRQLHGRFGLPVYEVDERYTSVEAQSLGADDIDSFAAQLIAEQFLRDSNQSPNQFL